MLETEPADGCGLVHSARRWSSVRHALEDIVPGHTQYFADRRFRWCRPRPNPTSCGHGRSRAAAKDGRSSTTRAARSNARPMSSRRLVAPDNGRPVGRRRGDGRRHGRCQPVERGTQRGTPLDRTRAARCSRHSSMPPPRRNSHARRPEMDRSPQRGPRARNSRLDRRRECSGHRSARPGSSPRIPVSSQGSGLPHRASWPPTAPRVRSHRRVRHHWTSRRSAAARTPSTSARPVAVSASSLRSSSRGRGRA